MSESIAGAIFLICLLIGITVGYFIGYVEIGGSIGLGLGLISLLFWRKKKRYR
ncbi:hypothetical protein NSQ77_07855 [Oceanobacillus sp. FSL K6-2867]|uniref:hypothetical protein n=1 Tax=Oceanobacillus sp. FSL K6-2867 TaxID=2954748 RepID=UPI0030DB7883